MRQIRDVLDLATVTPSLRCQPAQTSWHRLSLSRGLVTADNISAIAGPSCWVFIDGVFVRARLGSVRSSMFPAFEVPETARNRRCSQETLLGDGVFRLLHVDRNSEFGGSG